MMIMMLLVLMQGGSIQSTLQDYFMSSRRTYELREASFIRSVFDKYFKDGNYMLIMHAEKTSSHFICSDLLRQSSHSHIPVLSMCHLSNTTNYEKFQVADATESSNSFISITGDLPSQCFVDSTWTSAPFWNPRTFFLLVVTNPTVNVPDKVLSVLKDCWAKLNILNLAVIYLTTRKPALGDRELFYQNCASHYNPFMSNETLRSICDTDNSRNDYTIYPEKLLDMRQSPIGMTHFTSHPLLKIAVDYTDKITLDGPHGKTYKIVMDKFNCTIVYMGRLNMSQQNDTKFSQTFLGHEIAVLRPLRNNYLYPYSEECETLVVPKAEQLPGYMNFILPFTLHTWLAYIMSLALYAAIWECATFFSSESEYDDTILETVRLFISGATKRPAKSFSKRLFLLMGVFINIIFGNAYQGSLTSFITVRQYYPDINTLQEFLKSGFKVSSFTSLEDLINVLDILNWNKKDLAVLARYVYIPRNSDALDMVAYSRNVTRFLTRTAALYEVSKPRYFRDGFPLLHIMENCYKRAYFGFLAVVPSNPYLARFNSLHVKTVEAGIVSKWRRDFVDKSSQMNRILRAIREPTTITTEHILFPFICLLMGLIFSATIFVCEFFITWLTSVTLIPLYLIFHVALV